MGSLFLSGSVPCQASWGYKNFDIDAGPLPAKGTMIFTVDQFYTDGSVAHWDQVARSGAAESAHPAPVLTVKSSSNGSSNGSSDGVARVLAIAGLVVGVAALSAGLVLARRKPRAVAELLMRLVRRGVGALLVLVAAVFLLAFFAVSRRCADDVLESTNPTISGTVATAPTSVALTFDEQPRGQFSVIHVLGPDGQRRDSGHVQVVNDVVTEPLAGTRPAGRYAVDWRVVSADGHVVSGQFSFTATAAAPQVVARSAAAGPASKKSSVRQHRRDHPCRCSRRDRPRAGGGIQIPKAALHRARMTESKHHGVVTTVEAHPWTETAPASPGPAEPASRPGLASGSCWRLSAPDS